MAITFEGEFEVRAPRDTVFAFLADPQKFAPCLPTFRSVEMQNETTAAVVVGVGVGKIRGDATVTLELTERNPPLRAGYSGKGKIMGGAFNLETAFDLEDGEGSGTKVRWKGDLSMFGKLVALAGGLIKPIARKDIERLVAALKNELDAVGDRKAAV